MARTTSDTSKPSRFAPLTEDDIRARTDEGSFTRGRSYHRSGHIVEPVIRGDPLEAQCLGSEAHPYRVTATLAPADRPRDNPRRASCSCPRGGFCKHIVALLLTWIHQPERFAERASVAEQLADKSHEELAALVERMVQRHPDLERLIELPLPAAAEAAGDVPANAVTVDETVIRKQVRAALAGVSPYDHDYGWGDSWGQGFRVPPEIRSLLEVAQSYVAARQWANAHVIFAALAGEILEEAEEWMFTSDEEGELGAVVVECDGGLADCLDAQDELPEAERLSPEAREQLIRSIYDIWQYDVFDFGGYDLSQQGPEAIARNATDAERATVKGWLREIRFGDAPAQQSPAEVDRHRRTVVGFLSILFETDSASDEEILALYREAELWDDVAALLLRQDRVDEAVAVAGRQIRMPSGLITFANALIARDAALVGRAIALVDDLAWETDGADPGYDTMLQNWLIDQLSHQDRPREALELAERRFRRQPTIPNYRSLPEIAARPALPPDTWETLRPKLVDYLWEQQAWSVLVDVYLDEGEVASALDAFDRLARLRQKRMQGIWAPMSWGYDDQELRLARVAERDFPDRAVAIYRRRAEGQIERRQRSSYREAAKHLERVRETLERHGRRDEWNALIAEIREKNRTLRALREELDALDLR